MMGGGLGTWISERHKLSEDIAATNTLSGMSGAWGGLLASPILTTVLVLELARPKAARFTNTLVATLLSSSVAFAVYFPIAGSTFVGLYTRPPTSTRTGSCSRPFLSASSRGRSR